MAGEVRVPHLVWLGDIGSGIRRRAVLLVVGVAIANLECTGEDRTCTDLGTSLLVIPNERLPAVTAIRSEGVCEVYASMEDCDGGGCTELPNGGLGRTHLVESQTERGDCAVTVEYADGCDPETAVFTFGGPTGDCCLEVCAEGERNVVLAGCGADGPDRKAGHPDPISGSTEASVSLSPTMIGRIGASLLEAWAAQAGITAKPSFHDEKGWDVLLQLPASHGKPVGPLDRTPPGLTCMVQVKSTTSLDSREPIKLSNWQRMCSEPIPWFVRAIRLDPGTQQPIAAYVVHIGEDWCSAVLRKRRELGPEARSDLHNRYLNVSWSDKDKLAELHGRALAARIRKEVPDQLAYVSEKVRWFNELGYKDDAGRIAVAMPGNEQTILGHLADLAIGQERHFPKG
jgi:hypothetical protein